MSSNLAFLEHSRHSRILVLKRGGIEAYDFCGGFDCGVWTLFHTFSVSDSDYITNIDLLTLLLEYTQHRVKCKHTNIMMISFMCFYPLPA